MSATERQEDPNRRDVRRAKVLLLIDDMLARGVVPSAIEVDGMRVEVLSFSPKQPDPDAQSEHQLAPGARHPGDTHPASYRRRFHDELRRRRSEMGAA